MVSFADIRCLVLDVEIIMFLAVRNSALRSVCRIICRIWETINSIGLGAYKCIVETCIIYIRMRSRTNPSEKRIARMTTARLTSEKGNFLVKGFKKALAWVLERLRWPKSQFNVSESSWLDAWILKILPTCRLLIRQSCPVERITVGGDSEDSGVLSSCFLSCMVDHPMNSLDLEWVEKI